MIVLCTIVGDMKKKKKKITSLLITRPSTFSDVKRITGLVVYKSSSSSFLGHRSHSVITLVFIRTRATFSSRSAFGPYGTTINKNRLYPPGRLFSRRRHREYVEAQSLRRRSRHDQGIRLFNLT